MVRDDDLNDRGRVSDPSDLDARTRRCGDTLQIGFHHRDLFVQLSTSQIGIIFDRSVIKSDQECLWDSTWRKDRWTMEVDDLLFFVKAHLAIFRSGGSAHVDQGFPYFPLLNVGAICFYEKNLDRNITITFSGMSNEAAMLAFRVQYLVEVLSLARSCSLFTCSTHESGRSRLKFWPANYRVLPGS